MTHLSTPPAELAAIALDVARKAARLAWAGYRQRPEAREKRPADLVTAYDLESERFIRDALSRATPEMAIVAEETGGSADNGLAWYCDPLDGTTNFVHGHPFWAVSLGVLDHGLPIAGAVVAPALAIEWWGSVAAGAFRNGEPCRVSSTAKLGESLVATGFPSDRSRAPDINFEAFCRAKQRVRGIRRCGSAAIDCCLVADGTYDGYWERSLNAWDLAAGAAVAAAAGASVTALDGGRANLAIGHVLVTNSLIHDALRALVA
jgi:myo-inositol-1(or 4)-monophosphatase